MTQPGSYRITGFADAGVWISAPADLTGTLTGVTETDEMKRGQDDFRPVRIIGNLKLTNAVGDTRFSFDPPVRLQVRFDNADAETARQRGRRLAIAWWNEDTRMWVKLTEGSTVLAPGVPPQGGNRYFDIPAIDDPPISWGT